MAKDNVTRFEISDPKDISVIIPVYNSEECIEELTKQLTGVLDNLNKTYEIILINDKSEDKSWDKIVDSSNKYDVIRGLNLRKNFGQDNAIMAGLNFASGDRVIIMDDDLQHDPRDIPALLGGLEESFDVCFAHFHAKKQRLFKNLGSWFNDKMANFILKKPKEIYLSPYKALNREIVDEIVKYDGPYPYINGLIFRITRSITQVAVDHNKRYAGKGNYNLIKSIRHWSKLATNFSVLPLRIATFLGFSAAGLGFMLGIFYIIQYIVIEDMPAGWPTLIVTILFLGGIQLISIGVIGEYLGRLFLYQSKDPQFIVKEITGNKKQ